MKLTETIGELKVLKESPGLFTCMFEHQIKESRANFTWTGPKMEPEVWNQILSFFRWTYDTTKGEAQVRLYVDATGWKAWAFPQKARTGMSSEELPDNPDTAKQRVQFKDMLYFGTVHHHCSMSAFQSGTDKNNEKDQDGLHITVGHIDKERVDLHCRFYVKGACFKPDMGLFWDIGDAKELLPPKVWSECAEWQMSKFEKVDFPNEWQSNFIEIKTTPVSQPVDRAGFSCGYGYGSTFPGYETVSAKHERAARELVEDFVAYGLGIDEVIQNVESVQVECEKTVMGDIVDCCKEFEISFDTLLRELRWLKSRPQSNHQITESASKKGKGKKGKGDKEQNGETVETDPSGPQLWDY